MVKQNIWIAITIGVLVAGIGIGYGIFSSSQVMSSPMMNSSMDFLMNDPQAIQQMMQDPDFRNEMIESMIQDTDHMNQWMLEDPQHISIMIEEMKQNHEFMMGIAMPMVQDSGLRLQLLGHMTESPEVMAQMQQMISDGMTGEQSMSELMDDGSIDHDEAIGHDEVTMGMFTPPQTYIVSIAEGSGVSGCDLTDECYLPYLLEIWVGDTVSWNNVDYAAHTVTSGTPNNHDGDFDSGIMMANKSWEFIFTDSGEYDYYCVLHPWMTGKITVNEAQ